MGRIISTSLPCFCSLLRLILDEYEFTEGFQFGVRTASFQVEGGWNASGKGESIWDYITHNNPNFINDGSNANIACDTYHKIAEDVQLLKDMNVDYYCFSISWPRIFSNGHTNRPNEDGIRYYTELIDELLVNGITPLVTMFPLLVELFVNNADKLFYHFGDKVKNWITFNESYKICNFSYSDGILTPGYKQKGIGDYLCSYTVLIVHGRT
ncbi:glycosyl hydrolase [Holotrichia oblita]|uniref:Glycosyl hydrolase n=1 Tax=Holotrichia oblita TaxID=644536 RepID=A0ACB9TPX5_HOLOL|nr:glycosyl hydrolase [Holotrichia oblita]